MDSFNALIKHAPPVGRGGKYEVINVLIIVPKQKLLHFKVAGTMW